VCCRRRNGVAENGDLRIGDVLYQRPRSIVLLPNKGTLVIWDVDVHGEDGVPPRRMMGTGENNVR
jgi:hypothetical protein